jgi:glycosyltransferase involved in cell wall biosynthesis
LVRILYVAFDIVPAPKGAATHITAFAQALAGRFGRIDLVTAGSGTGARSLERWPGVVHTELPALGVSLVDRVLCFQAYLRRWLDQHAYTVIQFRSPFEGLPLLDLSPRPKLVFEVNGLPSIELKYRYPEAEDDRELMRKLRAQENACLQAADRVLTPSAVTAEYLRGQRGANNVHLVPNGVDLSVFQAARAPLSKPGFRMLYFGTLHSWQGVDLAIRALAQTRTQIDATLAVIGVGDTGFVERLASKLGVLDALSILPAMPQTELAEQVRWSDAVLAPLALNDRNVVQGCCPLKILEGMACGVPVIASDLPVVRELGCGGRHFLLVKPGSVDQMAEALLRLAGDREVGRAIGSNARRHIENNFTWARSGADLVTLYEEMMRSSSA